MVDRITVQQRSANMSKIKSKDTKPELLVRRLVHGLGYRYRLHGKTLPGRPDLVFGPRKKAIFVHGCYWHGHGCKRGGTGSKSNRDYWGPKIERNRARDKRTLETLHREGWEALVLWECEVGSREELKRRIVRFLGRRKR